MPSGEKSFMNRLIRKISAVILVCLLGPNLAAYAAVAVPPCSSPICSSDPMGMDHCNGLLDFGSPMSGCCGECGDIFCDLMKTSSLDTSAVNSSPFQANHYPMLLETADFMGDSSFQPALPEPWYLSVASMAWSQIPLYLQNLALII